MLVAAAVNEEAVSGGGATGGSSSGIVILLFIAKSMENSQTIEFSHFLFVYYPCSPVNTCTYS